MKIGLLGPAVDHDELLRESLDFLLLDAEVDQAIYLGLDGCADRVVQRWAQELTGGAQPKEAFLTRAADLACQGTPEDIEALLECDDALSRLASVKKLPPAPARAVEIIEGRIVTAVYDKALLVEEDIANSSILVFGKSEDVLLKRFGPRYFLTPGPLSNRKIAIIEVEEEGQLVVAFFSTNGAPLWREGLQAGRTSKLTVLT